MPSISFFPRAPDVSNEQSCLKTTVLYDDLLLLPSLFHLFYFIFNAPTMPHGLWDLSSPTRDGSGPQ